LPSARWIRRREIRREEKEAQGGAKGEEVTRRKSRTIT